MTLAERSFGAMRLRILTQKVPRTLLGTSVVKRYVPSHELAHFGLPLYYLWTRELEMISSVQLAMQPQQALHSERSERSEPLAAFLEGAKPDSGGAASNGLAECEGSIQLPLEQCLAVIDSCHGLSTGLRLAFHLEDLP